jgi:hypothetical protein
MRKHARLWLLAGALAAAAGCDLDRSNPNAPTQAAPLTSPDGVMALGVGIQNRYGTSLSTLIYTAGLVTDEFAATVNALINVRDAEQGRVAQGAGLVADLWSFNYRTIKSANDILASARNVEMEPGTRSGLLALAFMFKGEAFGELVQAFESVAVGTYNTETPSFQGRAAVLDSAERVITDTLPSARFNSTVLARGLDLRNTIRAFRARLLRVAGDDAGALAAAEQVDRRVFSVLPFDAANRNPVFFNSAGSSAVLPRDSFRLKAPVAEAPRVAYHVTEASGAAFAGFFQPNDAFARYSVQTAAIPAYYPDEMLLIKAEALVRLGRLPEAQAALDSVRTDCPGLVAADPNACLPALAGPLDAPALLAEIYENRKYELYATGLRWEDMRRLGQVGATSVAKRCWLPYPVAERNGNPENVPDDPEGEDPPAAPAQCF